MNSKELSKLLRTQDIYLTASEVDPCSNALLEALHTGLPSVALNDGGHQELIQKGGEVYNERFEISGKLDAIVSQYSIYAKNIRMQKMEEVAEQYIRFCRDLKLRKKSHRLLPLALVIPLYTNIAKLQISLRTLFE